MFLAATADDPSGLEVASWGAGVVTFVILVATALLYWAGRIRPLVCSARCEAGVHDSGPNVLSVTATVRSRTRNTQTVSDIAIMVPPSRLRRILRPRWYLETVPLQRFDWSTLDDMKPTGLEVPGHDTKTVHAYKFGEVSDLADNAHLLVTASRRRPVITPITTTTVGPHDGDRATAPS